MVLLHCKFFYVVLLHCKFFYVVLLHCNFFLLGTCGFTVLCNTQVLVHVHASTFFISLS